MRAGRKVEAPERRPLSADGTVYVTLAAAEQYQRDARASLRRRLGLEEARQELTRHMLAAHVTGDGRARYRSRSLWIDITARVVVRPRARRRDELHGSDGGLTRSLRWSEARCRPRSSALRGGPVGANRFNDRGIPARASRRGPAPFCGPAEGRSGATARDLVVGRVGDRLTRRALAREPAVELYDGARAARLGR